MSQRFEDTLLGNKAYGIGENNPMLNLKRGGQMGWAPVLGEWVSNAAYKRQHVIPFLLQEPLGFKALPNPEYWTATLKALVEQHVRVIDGLNAGLEVQTASHPVGGGGQQQLEFVNVTETPTNVTMNWEDKYGMPIGNFWRRYITYLMMDPNSKVAGLSTLTEGKRFKDMLPDVYSFSMLFVEPDPHHVSVVKAWIVSNLFPQSTGDIVGRRDITQDLDLQPVDITFGGIAQYGPGVKEFAQSMLDRINITGASPMNRKAFINTINADVDVAQTGYKHSVQETARGAVKF